MFLKVQVVALDLKLLSMLPGLHLICPSTPILTLSANSSFAGTPRTFSEPRPWKGGPSPHSPPAPCLARRATGADWPLKCTVCVGCVRVGVCVWEGVPALCSLGHCQLDSPPGQWSKHYQQLWLVIIFLQGVFKDLCSCDFLFLFSIVLLFERLRDEEKLNGNKYVFLVTLKHNFK